jgi:hypothetical protein
MTRDDVTSAQSGPQPQQYEIRVRGHLGETMRFAFPALRAQPRGADTVLKGALHRADQGQLPSYGSDDWGLFRAQRHADVPATSPPLRSSLRRLRHGK